MGVLSGRWDRRRFLAATAAGAATAGLPSGPHDASRPLYLGTYTTGAGAGTGIGLAAYDTRTGGITGIATLPLDNPSFLALSPTGRTLYAVNEQPNGSVTALASGPTGRCGCSTRGPPAATAPPICPSTPAAATC
ncbi:hypothetical protein GCM10009753_54210 [Streptantibioticus ferralitis]